MHQMLIVSLFIVYMHFRASEQHQRHYTECTLSSGRTGECRLKFDCPLLEAVQEAQHCSYSRFAPVICCPLLSEKDASNELSAKRNHSTVNTPLETMSLLPPLEIGTSSPTPNNLPFFVDNVRLSSRALLPASVTPLSIQYSPNSFPLNQNAKKVLQPIISSKNNDLSIPQETLATHLLPPKIHYSHTSPKSVPPIIDFDSDSAYLPPSNGANSGYESLPKSLSSSVLDIFPPANHLLPPSDSNPLPRSSESFPFKYIFLNNHFPLPIESSIPDHGWITPGHNFYELFDTYPLY